MSENKSERKHKELFKIIHETAQDAGLEIIEDKINRRGGVCRLDDKVIVIYDVNTSVRERNRLLLNGLKQINTDEMFIPPQIRDLIGNE